MSNIIGFNNAIFWTDDTEILYCEFSNTDPNAKLESTKAKLYIKAITTLCKGKAMPFVIDLTETCGTFTTSVAKFIVRNSELKKLRISESFIIGTTGVKLLITLYKKFYDPATPFRIFADQNLAQAYSLETKQKYHNSIKKVVEDYK
ncbi:hypothetical protein [Winogradskyella ouciana]|uniref:DUF7793 family protein n=1 Tax=Winogradskyella ouciana TaxID=2608631 RepID=UPI003D2AB7AD